MGGGEICDSGAAHAAILSDRSFQLPNAEFKDAPQANIVRNQLLDISVSAKMERAKDLQMQSHVHDLLTQEMYSKELWDSLSIHKRKDVLVSLLTDLNKILGTEVSAEIVYFCEDSGARGAFVSGTNQVRINEYFLLKKTSYQIMQTMIHEMRHAYQHYSITNPGKVTVSKETIQKWSENFMPENYKSPKKGDSFEEYLAQPVEWDAKNFAKQITEIDGVIPVYAGSWIFDRHKE